MSAVSLNSNDRELDALRRAQRAHEPCMEEILTSIRNIIADDRELLSRADRPGPASQRPVGAASGPQIVYSKDAPAPRREDVPALEPATPKVAPSHPEPPNSLAAFEALPEEEPLVSPATEEAVASAFDALSANLAAQRAEIADGMTRELLRPMLKAWLDENLPGIVEPLVRAEIERVARRSR